MSGGVSGMRQRTRRPSVRVSLSFTERAASHSAAGSAAATRRWDERTTGVPAQREMASSITGEVGSVPRMRLIQHKREAYWFYRFLSPLYDRWVNPLFWTAQMRDSAMELARFDSREL